MTTEKHDPWALLAAARGSVLQHKERLLDCDHEYDCTCDLAAQKIVLLDRIDAALEEHDAALAEHYAVLPSEEWWEDKTIRATMGDIELMVQSMGPQDWYWHAVHQERRGTDGLMESRDGRAATLDEAKSAAIAAARGMK